VFALGLLLTGAWSAIPEEGSPPPLPPASANPPVVEAHPAIWTAHGKRGTVYLLGSVHALPASIHWRTPEITDALAKADVFVFEIVPSPDAQASLKKMVAEHGTLPPGTSLRGLLSPEGQADFDKVLASVKLPLVAVDGMRPWLASLTISVARMMQKNGLSVDAGLDQVLTREATDKGKELRALESMEQQFSLLASPDDDQEVEQFESGLKQFLTQSYDLSGLLDAWASGDPAQIDGLFNKSLVKYPKVRKMLLDDRNRAWIKKIEPMLDNEDKVFFITVGAGHLVGKNGVPNLLRRAGYKVDGP